MPGSAGCIPRSAAVCLNRCGNGYVPRRTPLPDWFDLALQRADIQCLPVTPKLLHASTVLPDIHKDPADRIIIATAQAQGALLVTADETIQTYPDLTTVWADPSGLAGPVEGDAP